MAGRMFFSCSLHDLLCSFLLSNCDVRFASHNFKDYNGQPLVAIIHTGVQYIIVRNYIFIIQVHTYITIHMYLHVCCILCVGSYVYWGNRTRSRASISTRPKPRNPSMRPTIRSVR
ncbi:uncharacterized protein GGS25DRAFT_484893 [Hypoxylon fragiforme]|uniref:uncharacterized protein n=1 Tax=Hypoxylon fragiforme TaxID=63214 RepID=UPI0020C6EC34|nr:uncharacterized protein GGS25DRAFT_484893 [Hypoxylon fragiforme]KAI2609464.1 hypothetical protein GGS25DRAFT_484893 [Hypoxylon fragiforme]